MITQEEFKAFREQVYGKFKDYDDILRSLLQDKTTLIAGTFDDTTAATVKELYPEWEAGITVAKNDRYRYQDTLYKCLQAHTTQTDWTPTAAASLWAKVLIPDADVIPEWTQPTNANPYMKGDVVTHSNKTWESTTDNNVWEPGVYGWTEI